MLRIPINRLTLVGLEWERDIMRREIIGCVHIAIPDEGVRNRLTNHDGLVIDYVEPGVTGYQWDIAALAGGDHDTTRKLSYIVGASINHGGVWRPADYKAAYPTRFVFETVGYRGLITFGIIRYAYEEFEDLSGDRIPRPTECIGAQEVSAIKRGELIRRLTEAPEAVDTVSRTRRARTFG